MKKYTLHRPSSLSNYIYPLDEHYQGATCDAFETLNIYTHTDQEQDANPWRGHDRKTLANDLEYDLWASTTRPGRFVITLKSKESRIRQPWFFPGAHYLTDVLAGVAVGIAWSGVIYTLIEIYSKKRRSQNVKKG